MTIDTTKIREWWPLRDRTHSTEVIECHHVECTMHALCDALDEARGDVEHERSARNVELHAMGRLIKERDAALAEVARLKEWVSKTQPLVCKHHCDFGDHHFMCVAARAALAAETKGAP